MSRSLGARLVAAAFILVTIALFLTWLSLSRLFAHYVAEAYQRELQAVSDTLAAGIRVENGALRLKREPADPRFHLPAGGRYWQVDGLADGQKRSRSLWDLDIKPQGIFDKDAALGLAPGPSGGELVTISNNVAFEDGGKTLSAMISVGADRADYDRSTREFRQELMMMLGLTGLFLGLASALQIFIGLSPLAGIRKAVAAVRRGEASRIEDRGPVEVRPLISEINTLLDSERAAVERARARAADLAHGLKTPLTILSQLGETLERDGDSDRARRLAEQVATIRSRTDRQLALARAGGRGATAIDASVLAQKLAAVVRPLGERSGISVDSAVPTGLMVIADATDFSEAVGNLVDNAMRHARSNVVISGMDTPASIRITVSDDGPGIAEADRAAAMIRGQRLDESGGGSGLGLAITADILRAYGGSISLESSAMGGLAVHLDWPNSRRARTS